jgi:hypothetical protein
LGEKVIEPGVGKPSVPDFPPQRRLHLLDRALHHELRPPVRPAAAVGRIASHGVKRGGVTHVVRTVQPVLDRYCIGCHGLGKTEGGINLRGCAGASKSSPVQSGTAAPADRAKTLHYRSLAARKRLTFAVPNPGPHASLLTAELATAFARLLRTHAIPRKGFWTPK